MTRRCPARWLLLAALAAGSPVAAQDDGAQPLRWSGALSYDGQQIAPSPNAAFSQVFTVGVERRLANGSLALQGIASRRFDLDDQAVAFEVYHGLWRGAYGNARLSVAPGAEALPSRTVGGEIFQTIGASELSGSYRYQHIAAADVHTLGLGSGYYLGDWYLRPRGIVAHVEDSWSPFVAITARRYLGERTGNSFDLSLGFGVEVLEVAPLSGSSARVDVVTSGSRFGAVSGRRFLNRRMGVTAGGSYSDYEEIPDRWGVTLGLIARW